MTDDALKKLLDYKATEYEQVAFIQNDPILIPYIFTQKQDIEIAGFFAATIAWEIEPALSIAVKSFCL